MVFSVPQGKNSLVKEQNYRYIPEEKWVK